MDKNKEKNNDLETIFGMNRVMFFVIVALVCILSISVGIYASVFYKYKEKDPFVLGMGIKNTQEEEKLNSLSRDFLKIFTNDVSGNTTLNNIKRLENSKQSLVYTKDSSNQEDSDTYKIHVNVPTINISSSNTDRINSQIHRDYWDKVSYIMDSATTLYDYNVNYKAYLNGHMLSLIINETEVEGSSVQTSKIATYNINLNNNESLTLKDVLQVKGYTEKEVQDRIYDELKALNKSDEDLAKTMPSVNVMIRDLSNEMYKVENTRNCIVDDQGYLYIIYAYGNTTNTTKIDVIIFE